MSLRQALAWSPVRSALFAHSTPEKLEKLYHRFVEVYPEPTIQPEPASWREWARKARDDAARGMLSSYSAKDWKKTIPLLWWPDHEGRLAHDKTILESLIAWLERDGKNRRSVLRAILGSYSLFFDPASFPSQTRICTLIRPSVRRLDWDYATIDERFALLSPDTAPNRFAQVLWQEHIEAERPNRRVLEQYRINPATGLEEESFRVLLKNVQALLEKKPSREIVEKICSRVRPRDGQPAAADAPFLFLDRPTLANALLNPFLDPAMPSELRAVVKGFFKEYYGHPNVHADHWIGVRTPLRDMVRRWVEEDSIELFVQILNRVEKNTEVNHWQYRRAFWMGLYKENYITDVYLGLGAECEKIAREISKDQIIDYAALGGSGILAKHAVLMMKIDGHTIVDFNFNGQCRIWKRGNQNAPQLYKEKRKGQSRPYYDGSEIRERGADFNKRHSGDWQSAILSILTNDCGVRINGPMQKRLAG